MKVLKPEIGEWYRGATNALFSSHFRADALCVFASGTRSARRRLIESLARYDEPIVLIEETSEILIDKPNLVRFEARRSQAPLGQEAPLPAVTIADLLRATLRHRPDRGHSGAGRHAHRPDPAIAGGRYQDPDKRRGRSCCCRSTRREHTPDDHRS